MPGPMEGVRVIELGVWVAGPAAGGILADWGADVVKIEPPGVGDPARLFSKMLGSDLPMNPPFEMDNRNKRSIVVDLRKPEGRELAYEMIDDADVFVTNVRPAALRRLGFDSDTLAQRNPRLVYGMITGYGLDGPEADRAAYDIAAFWARAGIAASLTHPGGDPPFQRGGMGDHNTGLAAAGAISAALFRREKTGKGQVISTSLLREGIYTLSFDMSISLRFGVGVQIGDRKTMGNPAINNYQCSEGSWFWIVGLEGERHWPPLARAVGHPEWIQDPRFREPADRFANAAELIGELDAIFATKTRDEWGAIFDAEQDLWWAPVQTVEEVLADPQAHAAGAFIEVPDGQGTTLLPATPVDFLGTPLEHKHMAPTQGEHSDEILGEMGRSAEEIAALREKAVVA
ncbi:MAG: CoA transferase [Deltaproteobacteria bacterium]|nr:CoA transferase [Deltaproteobacteria bacterium]MBW2382724.1 CoA transferase [Deltaproteobacteria bacterium]